MYTALVVIYSIIVFRERTLTSWFLKFKARNVFEIKFGSFLVNQMVPKLSKDDNYKSFTLDPIPL